jgi:PilZ domain-containing protein
VCNRPSGAQSPVGGRSRVDGASALGNMRAFTAIIRCMEHRRGDRITVDLPVGIKNPVTSHSRIGRLVNISVDGALIRGSFDSHVGARVHVCIEVAPHTTSPDFLIAAYLVRKAADAFAVQWAEYAPTEILAFVREYSAQAYATEQSDQAQETREGKG